MKSTTKFRFGDGMVLNRPSRVNFPSMIGRQKIQITSDVIDSEISLLLSKDSMKQTDSQIDFSNDEKKMLTKKLKLRLQLVDIILLPLVIQHS